VRFNALELPKKFASFELFRPTTKGRLNAHLIFMAFPQKIMWLNVGLRLSVVDVDAFQ
jgi:hypothetical protein